MRAKDIVPGQSYSIRYPGGRANREVVDVEPAPGAGYIVTYLEPCWTWDYENRPEGMTEVDYMVNSKDKKAVYAPKICEVMSRNVFPLVAQ